MWLAAAILVALALTALGADVALCPVLDRRRHARCLRDTVVLEAALGLDGLWDPPKPEPPTVLHLVQQGILPPVCAPLEDTEPDAERRRVAMLAFLSSVAKLHTKGGRATSTHRYDPALGWFDVAKPTTGQQRAQARGSGFAGSETAKRLRGR